MRHVGKEFKMEKPNVIYLTTVKTPKELIFKPVKSGLPVVLQMEKTVYLFQLNAQNTFKNKVAQLILIM